MRFPLSLRLRGNSAAAALAVSAAFMLVPANILPVLSTETPGENRTDTILSGALELWRSGLWGVAVIVLLASIVIPFLKLVGLAWLLYNARNGPPRNPRRLTRIYAIVDFIGRWSMLDVFLAALLAGLIRFGELADVQPQSGIIAFGLAVVLTVLANQAFDPRVFWPQAAVAPKT
ncbi:MAG TPA: paraquat-inducible protein A [Opitutaceae bacterium]|jgi:paraquat-inducible protein A